MEEIIKGIQRLAVEELARANEQHPLFASDHEAYAVVLEELEETKHEVEAMDAWLDMFKKSVFNDFEDNKDMMIRKVRSAAVLCAAEAVQVIAMCDKRMMSKIDKNV